MRYWPVLVIGAAALLVGCADHGAASGGSGSHPPMSGQNSDSIRGIQAALAQQGYDPGPVDGSYGAKTAAAIRRYQQDHSLPIDGQASPGLLASLQGKPQASGASAPAASSPATQGSGMSDFVNDGWQKIDQQLQKLGQSLHSTIDGGAQKVDQEAQKVGLAAPAVAAESAPAQSGSGNAGSDPCPRDVHGRGVGADCSVRKHWNQEHPGAAPSGVTQSAAPVTARHPGEKWGYLQLSGYPVLGDEHCCTLKVADSVADGASIEVPVSSGSFAAAKHDFVQSVRGTVRRGQGQNGADVFEATALYHQARPHLSESWARTAGWLSLHQTVPLIH